MSLRACTKRSCNVLASDVAHSIAAAANSRGFHVATFRPGRLANTAGTSSQSITCLMV